MDRRESPTVPMDNFVVPQVQYAQRGEWLITWWAVRLLVSTLTIAATADKFYAPTVAPV